MLKAIYWLTWLLVAIAVALGQIHWHWILLHPTISIGAGAALLLLVAVMRLLETPEERNTREAVDALRNLGNAVRRQGGNL